jgi:hypothetical protein
MRSRAISHEHPTRADSAARRAAFVALAVVCALILAFLLFQGQRAHESDTGGDSLFPTSIGWIGGSKRTGPVNSEEGAGPTHGPTPADLDKGAAAPAED